MKKRRHHYVWRHYLEGWAREGLVACYQEGRIFSTNPINLAVMKDFYRLKELSEADLKFIKQVIERPATEPLRNVNRAVVPFFTKVFQIRDLLRADHGRNQAMLQQLDIWIQNAEEELHDGIEREAIDHLTSLREGDIEFLRVDKDLALFLHFLAVQLLRTRKGEEDVLRMTRPIFESPSVPVKINMEAVWPVLRHFLATNMGFYLFTSWDRVRCCLLHNSAVDGFITTDQPVFNLAAPEVPSTPPPEDLDLLYPISPTVAVRLTLDHPDPGFGRESVSELEIHWYNHRIWQRRGKQAFATSEELLGVLAKGADV